MQLKRMISGWFSAGYKVDTISHKLYAAHVSYKNIDFPDVERAYQYAKADTSKNKDSELCKENRCHCEKIFNKRMGQGEKEQYATTAKS